VCIVDSSGRITQSYGGAEGSGIGQLNEPFHLAVDGYGKVLVADESNCRVVLLCPLLTHLGNIEIPGHELSFTRALHLDELTHRLYIGKNYLLAECVIVLSF